MLIVLLCEGKYLSHSILNAGIMVFSGSIIYFVTLLLLKDKFLLDNMIRLSIRIINKKELI